MVVQDAITHEPSKNDSGIVLDNLLDGLHKLPTHPSKGALVEHFCGDL
jgi:hypothetical protein